MYYITNLNGGGGGKARSKICREVFECLVQDYSTFKFGLKRLNGVILHCEKKRKQSFKGFVNLVIQHWNSKIPGLHISKLPYSPVKM